MSLNIKKDAVHALARQAAGRSGLSQTSVIEEALGMYLARLDPPAADERRRQVDDLLGRLDVQLDDRARALLLDDGDLYDEAGLPA